MPPSPKNKSWIAGGEWFNGHDVPRIEIYTGRDDSADPDIRLDWCGKGCLFRWLEARWAKGDFNDEANQPSA
jgi:hypothetical protein